MRIVKNLIGERGRGEEERKKGREGGEDRGGGRGGGEERE